MRWELDWSVHLLVSRRSLMQPLRLSFKAGGGEIMTSRRFVPIGVGLAFAVACSASNEADTGTADVAAIREVVRQMFDAFTRGDLDAQLVHYADDVVHLPPYSPRLSGLPAVRSVDSVFLRITWATSSTQLMIRVYPIDTGGSNDGVGCSGLQRFSCMTGVATSHCSAVKL